MLFSPIYCQKPKSHSFLRHPVHNSIWPTRLTILQDQLFGQGFYTILPAVLTIWPTGNLAILLERLTIWPVGLTNDYLAEKIDYLAVKIVGYFAGRIDYLAVRIFGPFGQQGAIWLALARLNIWPAGLIIWPWGFVAFLLEGLTNLWAGLLAI